NHATRSLRTTKRLLMLFFIKSDDAFSDVTFRVFHPRLRLLRHRRHTSRRRVSISCVLVDDRGT
ncbi:hypothetical protein DWG17_26720, partial [Salmonella enterica subsp. enterica serovar Senftenberg]